MKAKKKAWIVIIVLAVIGFCVGFYFGYNGEKEKGLVRSEGKEYVVQDGDVVLFRFNV